LLENPESGWGEKKSQKRKREKQLNRTPAKKMGGNLREIPTSVKGPTLPKIWHPHVRGTKKKTWKIGTNSLGTKGAAKKKIKVTKRHL